MKKTDINKIGFTESFSAEADLYEDFYAGRVISQSKDLYKVQCEEGEVMAQVSGKFRFETKRMSDFPAVGDFVLLDRNTDAKGHAIIHHVLSRKSAFIRKAAGTADHEQVVAANIDTVFICMSLNNDFNLRRLERYLAIGWDSGATPVVLLTKSDLCEDLETRLLEAESVCLGAEVLVTCAMHRDGYEQLKPYLEAGRTVAFIGSSGVGKSTLINCLSGDEKLETDGLRKDDKGRHTTTRRELIFLNNGSMVIDTPGMRELGLESADFSKSFADIDELAAMCRFHDCSHTVEPGCAVQNAVEAGSLSKERLLSYQKLKKEARYEGLDSRQIETMKLDEMFRDYGGMKNARKFIKGKRR